MKRLGVMGLLCGLALGSSGCITQIMLDKQIEGTKNASAALQSMTDFEVARSAAYNGVATFEGMHLLAPANEDALFMLTKGWTSAAFVFIEDDYEIAVDKDGVWSDDARHHAARARDAYDRAIFYGLKLLKLKAPDFEAAKRNDDTMHAWLKNFDEPDVDAERLFWTGNAWIGKVNAAKDQPDVVADLFIGVAMVERAVELKPELEHASGLVVLGAYHARSAMAELDIAKTFFDRAITTDKGRTLMAQLQLAATYACFKQDSALYDSTLRAVLNAPDAGPDVRFINTIAKRRAERYLQPAHRRRRCGF